MLVLNNCLEGTEVELCFVEFAEVHSIKTPTVANFKLPISLNEQLGKDSHNLTPDLPHNAYFIWCSVNFFENFYCGKVYVTKFVILTIVKCTIQWY